MYLISACLVGINCRYNGTNTLDERLVELIRSGKAIAVCPEVLGRLPIPREPCEIIKTKDGRQKIISKSGKDYTNAYLEGANKTLKICNIIGIKKAILQSRSPSCGYGQIYDGTFSGKLIIGNGLTAKILNENGITIFNEENWKQNEDQGDKS